MSDAKYEAQLEAIEDAMAAGVLSVRYADREVRYSSFDEMSKARAFLLKKLSRKGSSVSYAEFDPDL